MLGLEGEEPERIDPDTIETRVARIRERAGDRYTVGSSSGDCPFDCSAGYRRNASARG